VQNELLLLKQPWVLMCVIWLNEDTTSKYNCLVENNFESKCYQKKKKVWWTTNSLINCINKTNNHLTPHIIEQW